VTASHRVLVTGMGGELGVRVANLLAARPDVEVVRGIDLDPPRRRTHGVDFVRVDPCDRRQVVPLVRDVDPTVVVHLGVYEPNARTGPKLAGQLNERGTLNTLGAAAECPSLERIVARSGIEIYGRRRGQATRPDESVAPDPTSSFGRQLLRVEELALETGRAAGAVVTSLRFAPLTGAAMPSPLGRYLRLPVVAFGGLADLPFALLHQNDAAAAIVAAVDGGPDAPVNVVGAGATTPAQAARMGGRIPLPILGLQWQLARVGAELLGAPLPDHVRELLTRGRVADGSAAADRLGVTPAWTTLDIVRDLYEWAPVTYLQPGRAAA
jgi:UDP-glucose 4-epimerase